VGDELVAGRKKKHEIYIFASMLDWRAKRVLEERIISRILVETWKLCNHGVKIV